MKKRILVLAPHTDDGELGLGGSMARFLEEGKDVFYVAFSTCKESIPKGLPEWTLKDELGASMHNFGISKDRTIILDYPVRNFPEHRQNILDNMIMVGRDINPDLVFIPSIQDIHQDHRTIASEALRAYKRTSLLGYELPWNNYAFNNQTFSIIEKRHVEKKIESLSCYKSQANRSYFKEEYITGVTRARGVQIGAEYAEVFETVRWII